MELEVYCVGQLCWYLKTLLTDSCRSAFQKSEPCPSHLWKTGNELPESPGDCPLIALLQATEAPKLKGLGDVSTLQLSLHTRTSPQHLKGQGADALLSNLKAPKTIFQIKPSPKSFAFIRLQLKSRVWETTHTPSLPLPCLFCICFL